ncbi:hypothetical protein TIFTF001_006888 [Ficus carica]|uniref:Uncharacterized protein n=1 Tax=Ficus carica TaxID=3494 RepID=A0AA87ZNV1_FICCA|nr:hypothetical protein TIFTF001_006888 [Ficus carica]
MFTNNKNKVKMTNRWQASLPVSGRPASGRVGLWFELEMVGRPNHSIVARPNDQACQHEELAASTPIINAPIETIEDCHLEEPTQRDEHLELFHNNDSLSEVGIQDLAIEE